MIFYLKDWYNRNFSDPQVAVLAIFLFAGLASIIFIGNILAPLIAGVVIAYVLDGAIQQFEKSRIPRFFLFLIVYVGFLFFVVLLMFGIVPLLSKQLAGLFKEIPDAYEAIMIYIEGLPGRYPNIIEQGQIVEFVASIHAQIGNFGQQAISFSLASFLDLITIVVYLFLVPLLVFFLLKDKEKIVEWVVQSLPDNRKLSNTVWINVNNKIAGYIRGKFLEILIVWLLTYIVFEFFDLEYSILLSFLVGLSVIIPYVGAIIVTVPVAFVAYMQWGFTSDCAYVLLAYIAIQIIDGNLIVPVLFSEIVDLHPVAIIAAILIFGSIWGIWGVFFAIPLATLVDAIFAAWPKTTLSE